MTYPRLTTMALLAGTVGLAASACGASSGQHASRPTTSTDGSATATTSSGASAPDTKNKRLSLSATPAKTLTFKGTAPPQTDIGKPQPLRIPTDSTIKWTNDGPLFQLIPASIHVPSPVNSRAHSGEAKIRKGSYHGFLVNAIGHWTITIVPGG